MLDTITERYNQINERVVRDMAVQVRIQYNYTSCKLAFRNEHICLALIILYFAFILQREAEAQDRRERAERVRKIREERERYHYFHILYIWMCTENFKENMIVQG